MIFVPHSIRFDRIDVVNNSLKVQTILSNDADPNDVKVSLIGKYEDSTSIRKLISFDNIEIRNGIPIFGSLEIGEGQAQLNLRLFYKKVQVDYHEVNRKGPSIQKPNWFEAVLKRIDPCYKVLEIWTQGQGTDPATDFERSVAILLCVCGLNTIHVGGSYEKATEKERRESFPNPETSVDVLAWSSNNEYLYLCQCSLNGVATFAKELVNSILMNYEPIPKIYPVVITNIQYMSLMNDELDDAKSKGVGIVAAESLQNLISLIRDNDIITNHEIQSYLTSVPPKHS
jgi:hypothetical protein